MLSVPAFLLERIYFLMPDVHSANAAMTSAL